MATEPLSVQALAAVVAALQTANGSGSYWNDLSVTGRVQIGAPNSQYPGALPCVWIVAVQLTPVEWRDLGGRRIALALTLNLFAGADGADGTARMTSILRLQSDCARALNADPTLGLSYVMPLTYSVETIEGAAVGYPGCMVGVMSVVIPFLRDPGDGL